MNMKIDSFELEEIKIRIENAIVNVSEVGNRFQGDFAALSNIGLYSSGINKIAAQMNSIATSFQSLARILSIQTGEIFNVESQLTSEINGIAIPDTEGKQEGLNASGSSNFDRNYSSSYHQSSGGVDYDGGVSNTGSVVTPTLDSVLTTETDDGVVSVSVPNIKVESLDVSGVSRQDLSKLSDILHSAATEKGISVSDILSNKAMLESLRGELRKLALSNEVLTALRDMDSEHLQTFLKNIYSEKVSYGGIGFDVVSRYLNGMTVSDLLSGKVSISQIPEFDSIASVDNYLEKLKLQSSDDARINLLYAYNGNTNDSNLDEGSVTILRDFVNTMADQKGISAEEILTNGEYNNYIANKISEMETNCSYLKSFVSSKM